jgi:hypothetical protein
MVTLAANDPIKVALIVFYLCVAGTCFVVACLVGYKAFMDWRAARLIKKHGDL